jgi:hypothetical protein
LQRHGKPNGARKAGAPNDATGKPNGKSFSTNTKRIEAEAVRMSARGGGGNAFGDDQEP